MRWQIKLVLLLMLVGVAVLLWMRGTPGPQRPSPSAGPSNSVAASLLARANAATNRVTRGRDFLARVYARRQETGLTGAGADTNSPSPQEIEDVLKGSETDVEKAKRLLGLVPSFPEEDQMEAAEHAANLVTDADYATLRDPLVNAQTPTTVLDVLLADLLNRGNSFKLPALVEIARQAGHPRSQEARDLLELHLGEDHGTNWSDWLDAVTNFIAQNGE